MDIGLPPVLSRFSDKATTWAASNFSSFILASSSRFFKVMVPSTLLNRAIIRYQMLASSVLSIPKQLVPPFTSLAGWTAGSTSLYRA